MPEFFIHYIGKINLEFLISEDFLLQGKEFVKGINFFKTKNIAKAIKAFSKLLTDPKLFSAALTNLSACFSMLKDYSSVVSLYANSLVSNPIFSYNAALCCTFTSEFKNGLKILESHYIEKAEFALLKIYILYLLHKDAKALSLFSSYQKSYAYNWRSGSRLRNTRPIQKLLNPSSSNKSFLQPRKSTSNAYHGTSSSVSLSTNQSNLKPPISLMKEIKPLVKSRVKMSKESLYNLKSKVGLNMEDLQNEALPELAPKLSLVIESPKAAEVQVLNQSQHATLTKFSMEKIIAHFTTSNKDIAAVYKIVKNLKFFSLYSKQYCVMLLNFSEYMFYQQGEIIVKEGDFADCIYVILEGSVSVQQEYKGMNFVVNSRYDGETIGEYAIARGTIDINEAKRSATCCAGEATHLLRIDSSKYAVVMNSMTDNLGTLLQFLTTTVLFEHASPVDLAYLANSLHLEKYFFERTVLENGETLKGIYVIFQGRLKAIYKKKEVQLPPKFFFGQRAFFERNAKSRCKIISYAVESQVLVIQQQHLDLLYKTLREATMNILAKYIQNDL